MGRETRMVGSRGETAAVAFLKKRGYRILETNSRTPFGEIDAVAKNSGHIVFIEVKSRITSSLGPPYLSVTPLKARHIVRNALYYLKNHGLLDLPWRIDVVSVKMNNSFIVENREIIDNAVEGDIYNYK
jgi:putative endonuclease